MPSFIKYATAAIAAVAPLAAAQTYTDCNPLDKTCPSDAGTTESNLSFDFTQSSGLDQWKTIAGTVNTGSNGAEFTINKRGDAPTIETDFYLFFGEISITMKAAPGTGIVSSLVFESDDLDEIDWEALGGDTTQIETNYFGKGDTSTYNRATWPAVSTPQDTWHTYTVNWQKDSTTWAVDGNVVRTLTYDEAKGGSRYPQTPMRVRIGIWAGGDPSNAPGTIQWAGGKTDYSQAPFTMYVKNVEIKNSNPAESYTYTDNSGSWQSIKMSGASNLSSSSSETSTTSTTSTTSNNASSDSSTAATTLATTTQTSSGVRTTAGSTSTGSSSGASSTGSSSGSSSGSHSGSPSGSASGSSTGSGSGSGSSTGSGTGSSTAGSGSGSGSSTSTSPSPTSTFNAAANVGINYLGPLSLLALVTAFIQL